MAKRKRKVHTVRRRRMSGYTADNIESTLAAVGGGILATVAISKFLPTMKPELKAGLVAATGFFIPKMIKGPLGAGLGQGIVAGAGIKLVQSLGVISGVMAGTGNGNLSLISGSGSGKTLPSSATYPAGRNLAVLNGLAGTSF